MIFWGFGGFSSSNHISTEASKKELVISVYFICKIQYQYPQNRAAFCAIGCLLTNE